MPRQYKKKSVCPTELKEILQWANILPRNIEEIYSDLRNLSTTFFVTKRVFSEKSSKIFRQKLNETLPKRMSDFLYKNLREYESKIIEFPLPVYPDYFLVLKRLRNIIDTEFVLRKLTRINQSYTAQNFNIDREIQQITLKSKLQIKDGFLKPAKNELIEIFDKIDVPLGKIRSCPVCQIIFWEKRAGSETCGNKFCSKSYSRKNKDRKEINEQRREKYHEQKGLTSCIECSYEINRCKC